MQKMAQDVKDGKVEPDGITEDTIESYLATPCRRTGSGFFHLHTSGERLSNFLLWQLAYSSFILHRLHGRISEESWTTQSHPRKQPEYATVASRRSRSR